MHQKIHLLKDWLNEQIVGQNHLVERLIVALLADGHLLVEGAPGLAKTKAIKTVSEGIDADFHRVQFTPDLLPSDITGSDIYRPEQAVFEFLGLLKAASVSDQVAHLRQLGLDDFYVPRA